jgi:hypothetical protein
VPLWIRRFHDFEVTADMTPEQARNVLQRDTWDDNGTFVLLRLGQDPGQDRIAQLRHALHVLWLEWKDHPALPYDLSESAAMILAMSDEARHNLRDSGDQIRPELITNDLQSLQLSAFHLLSGPRAEQDLGRNGEKWIA